MNEIMPLPVKKNKFGQSVKDISVTDYYRQIEEEVLEAHENAVARKWVRHFDAFYEAEELADIITCCVTRLEIIGYDEKARQKLYNSVNVKNCNRGYLED